MGIVAVYFVSFWLTTSAFGLDSAHAPAPSAASPTAPSPKSEISEAHAHFDKKEFAKVPPLLWKNIDKLERPDFYILIRAHNELGQAEDLLRVSTLLISRNSKDFEALHYQAKAYVMKKKEKEAIESYRKAIEANKKYLPSYLGMAEIYEKRKNLYELRSLYQDMLTVFGPRAEILTNLCKVNMKDGMNDAAEGFCRQGVQVDPEIPENHINLALITVHTGDRPKGKELLAKAADKFTKSEEAQFQYGSFLEEDKNYLDSYKYYKNCTALNAKSERCQLGFANSAFQIQKLQEAHDAFKLLCNINRSYAVNVRRALGTLRTTGPQEWTKKFDALSEYCSL